MENKVLEILRKVDKPMRPGDIAKELKAGKVISPKRCFYAPAK